MRTRLTTGIVALITAAAMTVPAVGLANTGGVPHTTPPGCHTHTNKGKHKGQLKNATKGKRNGESKGNKCGHAAS
jgi:hypothetical protein